MVIRGASSPLVIISPTSPSASMSVIHSSELVVVVVSITLSMLVIWGLVIIGSVIIITSLVIAVPLIPIWSGIIDIPSVRMIIMVATSILSWSLLVLKTWRVVECPSIIVPVTVIGGIHISWSAPIIRLSRTLAVPLVVAFSLVTFQQSAHSLYGLYL